MAGRAGCVAEFSIGDLQLLAHPTLAQGIRQIPFRSGQLFADRDRVFERMVRLDDSRDRRSGGSGLGLAVARGLARSHGGDVLLVPTDPPGAVFRLDLPAARPPEGSLAP